MHLKISQHVVSEFCTCEDGQWSQDGNGKCKRRVSNALCAENAPKAFKR